MNLESYHLFLDELRLYNLGEVAEAAGVAPATLYFWLEGRYLPRMSTVLKVAPVIGMRVDFVHDKARVRSVA